MRQTIHGAGVGLIWVGGLFLGQEMVLGAVLSIVGLVMVGLSYFSAEAAARGKA